jgi:alanine-synthesizing transaminase
MREIRKTTRLDNVGYDIRGPVAEEAARMMREGIEVTALNTGNPATFGFFAPEPVERAMRDNIRSSEGYSDSYGIPEAIEAIKAYSMTKGIEGLGYGDVFTGNGVSELINIALQALLDTGDEVLVPTPDYPLWTSVVTLCGGNARGYICDESAEWTPDITDIKRKITPKTKAIVVINPNNPTGALYPRDSLEDIMGVAREHGLVVFADEIYDRLVFDGAVHHSCAAVAPDVFTVTLNGLSKSHMLAGFRCGWMVVSGDKEYASDYIEGMRMLSSMRLCANVPSQSVIEAALGDAYSSAPLLAPGGRLYEQREFICKAISDIPGLSSTKPKAAFYLFPRIDTELFGVTDDETFVLDFLHEHHVLMTHGRGFNWPEPNHFRIVYLPQLSELRTIADKLRIFLSDYRQG